LPRDEARAAAFVIAVLGQARRGSSEETLMARRGRLGMHLDRDRGICKLNNDDRRQWIDNDKGLYNWKR